jgi:hypothetical protein
LGACLAAADCRGPLAIGVWFFIAIAWVISLGLSRDILKPSAATTTAFLDLSIRRCRHRLQALFADAVLFVMILAFDLVWISPRYGPWSPRRRGSRQRSCAEPSVTKAKSQPIPRSLRLRA